MCPYPPTMPPGLDFYWPWQAPGYWLLLCALLLTVTFGLITTLPKALDRAAIGSQRELALALLASGYVLTVMASIFFTVIGLASASALSGWVGDQYEWAVSNGCTIGLSATDGYLRSSIGTVLTASWVMLVGGLVLAGLAFNVTPLTRALGTRWSH